MKPASLLTVALAFFLVSCERDVTSPGSGSVSFQISGHILPGYDVTAISFDSKGTAWMGTSRRGLIRYDGSVTVYDSKNSTLPDSAVMWDITADRNDNVWIGTDVGLIEYDQRDFRVFNTGNSPMPLNLVWSLAADQNNALWFACCRYNEGGLMKLTGDTWTLYTPENSPLPANGVLDVVVDGKNNVWIATHGGVGRGSVAKITGDNWTTYGQEALGFVPYWLRNLAVDRDGDIYASIDYSVSSLADMTRPNIVKFAGGKWTIENPVDEKGSSLGYVGGICTDLTGNLWATVYGREGVHLAVHNGSKWIYATNDLPVDWSGVLAVDRTNTVWLGTGDGAYLIRQ